MTTAAGESRVPARRWARRGLIGAIRGYRIVFSPLLGPACRFDPSCSVYAIGVIERHGVARGGWLAVKRIGRCHPLGGFGYDPVP